jgi:hypothetical protein
MADGAGQDTPAKSGSTRCVELPPSTVIVFDVVLWKSARCKPRVVGLGLVTPVNESSGLRRRVHGPVDLPTLVVVLADLGVEATVSAVLEDVPREREDHRRVLGLSDDVLVWPRGGIGLGECPLRGFDKLANFVRKRSSHSHKATVTGARDSAGHTSSVRPFLFSICDNAAVTRLAPGCTSSRPSPEA